MDFFDKRDLYFPMHAEQPPNVPARQPMFYVGFCRICGTGPLGLRSCGGCSRIAVLCDECEAVWPDSNLVATPIMDEGKIDENTPCPKCHQSLLAAPSHWATAEEIAATDWLQQAFRVDSLQLQYGSRAAPRESR
jgi:hypothetical protein